MHILTCSTQWFVDTRSSKFIGKWICQNEETDTEAKTRALFSKKWWLLLLVSVLLPLGY